MNPSLTETSRSSYDSIILGSTYFDEELDKTVQELQGRLRSQYEKTVSKRESVSNIDMCLIEISKLVDNLDSFPISYNQVLLLGSLSYCEIALKKIKTHPYYSEILKHIQKYILLIKDFCDQHKDKTEYVSKIDLQLFEDRFDTIQKLCKGENILPFLEEMTLQEYPE